MEPNLTYVYPHTRVQSLVSILRTTVYHAFPVVTENRQNEQDFMKGNILVSNNIHFKVCLVTLCVLASYQEGVAKEKGGLRTFHQTRNDLVIVKHRSNNAASLK